MACLLVRMPSTPVVEPASESFSMTSFSTISSRLNSANICLSWLFFTLSTFIRLTSEASMSPYVDFHLQNVAALTYEYIHDYRPPWPLLEFSRFETRKAGFVHTKFLIPVWTRGLYLASTSYMGTLYNLIDLQNTFL